MTFNVIQFGRKSNLEYRFCKDLVLGELLIPNSLIPVYVSLYANKYWFKYAVFNSIIFIQL